MIFALSTLEFLVKPFRSNSKTCFIFFRLSWKKRRIRSLSRSCELRSNSVERDDNTERAKTESRTIEERERKKTSNRNLINNKKKKSRKKNWFPLSLFLSFPPSNMQLKISRPKTAEGKPRSNERRSKG